MHKLLRALSRWHQQYNYQYLLEYIMNQFRYAVIAVEDLQAEKTCVDVLFGQSTIPVSYFLSV